MLDPKKHEANKTQQEKAEDVAYTINHAIACTVTDFIDPYVGNLTQKYLGKRVSVGCGHDHHDHDHDHHDHDHSHLGQWSIGEVVGDFGAVPLTIACQRYLPYFMNGMHQALEPILGDLFHWGAERTAKKWADAEGVSLQSDAYKAKVEAIYRHEIDHLPQAVMWTVSSIALNLATQKLLGNDAPIQHMLIGKAMGASISAGLVVGGRGVAPGAARRWDQWTTKHLFLPASKQVGKVFGIDEQTIERAAEKNHSGDWAARVTEPKTDISR